MNREVFVQNIKKYCNAKGVKPTAACKESGVGGSFINDIDRGQTPSVAKVQMLAEYLGCTVSDLLGEEKQKRPADNGEAQDKELTQAEQELLRLLRNIPEDKKESVLLAIEMALRSQELLQ